MASTFEQSQREIGRLVGHFRINQAAYRGAGYKEAQTRLELIDPMFMSLGWDVGNAQHAAPAYREVEVEASLEVEGHLKAPDYSFRIGREAKFYVEAKKPGVDIQGSAGPAYQLRRYAWTKGLPLSVLTDFEEFAVYDTRKRPSEQDRASAARLLFLGFEEYGERWREVWDVFSKEAVLGGAFDQFAGRAAPRAKTQVDAEFLKDMEIWRELLARNFALRNPRLSVDDLNDAVQRTIDRIVFLRMAEDRGMEEHGRLQQLADKVEAYRGLIRLARQADDKYNSGLFDFSRDKLTPGLALDDKVLRGILLDLYFPHSPYAFNVLPPEILGSVYERFLGKVIRLTAGHQAKVEEKPEVRKAGGVYYTPAYIVNYIVGQTVGLGIAGKSPTQLRGYRVLDMACGSGSFLLGAYQALLDHYLIWYTENSPQKHPKALYVANPASGYRADPHSSSEPPVLRLTSAERKRILIEHIFGVDIDRQAVEVTKLSLLLKVLEGETDETLGRQMRLIHDRALPDLDRNIQCGNSLIGPDYFSGRLLPDADELKRVNPFDWKAAFPEAMAAGGFDAVIGNPPYIRMEGFKELKSYLKATYASHDERSDMYAYFIERSHRVLRPRGRFGMIVSNKFLRANYGEPLRGFIRENSAIESVVDFAGLPVFLGATVRTVVLITSRNPNPGEYRFPYSPPFPVPVFRAVASGSLTVEAVTETSFVEVPSSMLSQPAWGFSGSEGEGVLEKAQAGTVSLSAYCEGEVCRGVVSGLSEAFVVDQATRDSLVRRNRQADEILKPFLNGRDIRRYSLEPKSQHLIYTFHGVDIRRYPAVEKHLLPFRDRLQKRATRQEWYELQQPQYNFARFMDGAKIIFPDIATEPRFALDETGFYASNTAYFIPRRDLYLLGLLNSRFGAFYFKRVCAGLEGTSATYLRFFGQYLEGFPVRRIDFSSPAEEARHDKMVSLVERMLELHRRRQAAESDGERELLQRQIDSTDGEIDALVYELYGLSEEEIRIVEGSPPPQPSP
jgi:type I restriction-modification system DNA methylase subunit